MQGGVVVTFEGVHFPQSFGGGKHAGGYDAVPQPRELGIAQVNTIGSFKMRSEIRFQGSLIFNIFPIFILQVPQAINKIYLNFPFGSHGGSPPFLAK